MKQKEPMENKKEESKRVEVIKNLFRGRSDAYGIVIDGEEKCIREALTDQVYINHLQGKNRIGVYPIFLTDSIVYFACIDVDREDKPTVEKIMAVSITMTFVKRIAVVMPSNGMNKFPTLTTRPSVGPSLTRKPSAMAKADYFTVNELAKHLNVNPKTIYRRLWGRESRLIRSEDPGGLPRKQLFGSGSKHETFAL